MNYRAECPNHGPVFDIDDIGCPYCAAIRDAFRAGFQKAEMMYLRKTGSDDES